VTEILIGLGGDCSLREKLKALSEVSDLLAARYPLRHLEASFTDDSPAQCGNRSSQQHNLDASRALDLMSCRRR